MVGISINTTKVPAVKASNIFPPSDHSDVTCFPCYRVLSLKVTEQFKDHDELSIWILLIDLIRDTWGICHEGHMKHRT